MKTKQRLFIICLSLFILENVDIRAQVTIGSDKKPEKFSKLEVISNAEAPGGLRLPYLSEADKSKIEKDLKEDPSLSKGLFIFNTDKSMIEYWNGKEWVSSNPAGSWLETGTNNTATQNTQNIYQMGRVNIGTKTDDTTAVLNVEATNKGILLPRVALKSADDKATIPNPATGLLVYNTGKSTLKVEGYLYWNGSEWVQFSTSTSKSPEITALNCENARISPATYTKGKEYHGVLVVPYRGGNGGSYAGNVSIKSSGVTGLTAVLQPGSLNNGNGDLTFNLSGTPSESSPSEASFDVSFLGQSCTASVGSNSIAQGEIVFWHGSMPVDIAISKDGKEVLASNFVGKEMPVIENTFRLDAYFTLSSFAFYAISYQPRIYNISDRAVKYWWSGITTKENYGMSNVVLAPGKFQKLDNSMSMGFGSNMTMSHYDKGDISANTTFTQEVMTVDFFYENRWYRIFFTGWVDNHESGKAADMTRELYITYQRLY